ncbi:MAG TPA: RDD family protein [Solirubrobacterales bacterium]|nr:RDD family protein [Solirubrobacterales bacterium]
MADEPTSPESLADAARRNGRPATLPGRLIDTGARGARRVAGVTGLDRAVESVAEEAIVRAIESPAVERALERVMQGPIVEEAVGAAINSPAVERSVMEALDSEMVDRVWARLLASDETQKLVERIAEAPELRAAIAAQSVGVFEDLAQQARGVARRLDSAVERPARFLARRGRRDESPAQAGFVTRLMALIADAGILNAFFLIASALVAFVASLIAPDDSIGIVVGAGLWVGAAALYLLVFWAGGGQTPGERLMGIRLLARGSPQISGGRALRRLFGVGLCLLTLGIGFLPILFTKRRRGLDDWMAGTEVVYALSATRVAPWSELPVEAREAVPEVG